MPKPTPSGPRRRGEIDALTELALDLRWSWHHGTDELWSQLEPELWTLTRNPWVVLQVASATKVEEMLARPAHRERVDQLLERRRQHLAAPAWFQQDHAQGPLTRVAYFTTRTPVPAGFDRFEPTLIERYLGRYAETRLGISVGDLLALGRAHPADRDEPFNTAYLAVRGSEAVNGVSRLHGAVSRRIFQPLFPRWPEVEVPVGHVTNGVHTPSWDSPEADLLWTRTCGAGRWPGTMHMVALGVACASDEELWALRASGRAALVAYVRERMASHVAAWSASPDEAAVMCACLDPQVLTLRFARRFATYKRPNLLLRDPGRLLRLLCNRERPVQLVLAGKAHPADQAGQDMIREWIELIRRPDGAAGPSSCRTMTCSPPSIWSRAWTSGSTHRGGRGRRAAPAACRCWSTGA
jgi:alpha-glucan phosphorylase-like protein